MNTLSLLILLLESEHYKLCNISHGQDWANTWECFLEWRSEQ